MIKYKTGWDGIKAIKILRETTSQIVHAPTRSHPKGMREAKVSDSTQWHDTWEGAHAFLIDKAQDKIRSLRIRLEQANGTLDQIKGMTPME